MGAPAALDDAAGREVVRVEGLRKRYRRTLACDGIDIRVARAEIFGLIGPDGAGKSTLLKTVAGVLGFDAGRVRVFGQELDSEAAAERVKGRLGFMPQGLGQNLYAELSVEENIDFFARLRFVPEVDLARRKAELLALTRLDRFRERPMKQLSGGMKQKLALACTLIHAPELVILDEPTTGVDPLSRRDFWLIIARLLRERAVTVLVSTAYLDEAERFHRIALLHEGRVLAQGTPQELRGAAPDLEEACVALLRAREPRATPAAIVPAATCAPTAPHPGAAAIEAMDLSRDFGRFRAVDRVSFRVAPGEIFGMLGANGAGKTTVIKMLTGILPPSSGSGRVAGADMLRAPRTIKQRIGYVSQAFSLYTDLSVLENLRLYAGIYGHGGADARRRIAHISDMAGLGGHEADHAGELPMGLRQRLALGCALLHGPQVLFLDEPTSGVDPLGRRRLWGIFYRLAREEGVAILLTTHYMSEAEHCDRLALMHAGRIVADAAPQALKRQVEDEAGRLLEIDTDDIAATVAWLGEAGYAQAAPYGRAVRVLSRAAEADVRELPARLAAAGIAVSSIAPRALSMEEVFVHHVSALEREARRP